MVMAPIPSPFIISIIISCFLVSLFLLPLLTGGILLFDKTTARTGKRVLSYAFASLSCGVACCWMSFMLLMIIMAVMGAKPTKHQNDVATFFAIVWAMSGPIGCIAGAFVAWRFLGGKRGRLTKD